jgi:hypothetical protein
MKSRLAANRASSLGLLAGRSKVGNEEHPQIDEAELWYAPDKVEHDTQPDLSQVTRVQCNATISKELHAQSLLCSFKPAAMLASSPKLGV